MSNLNQKFIPFKNKLDNIITDLIGEGSYEDFMNLQNPETCGEITILLEEELNSKFSKVELVIYL